MNLTQTFASVVASSQIDANNIEPTVNNPAVATGAFSYMWLLLALPLLGAALLLIGGKRTD